MATMIAILLEGYFLQESGEKSSFFAPAIFLLYSILHLDQRFLYNFYYVFLWKWMGDKEVVDFHRIFLGDKGILRINFLAVLSVHALFEYFWEIFMST